MLHVIKDNLKRENFSRLSSLVKLMIDCVNVIGFLQLNRLTAGMKKNPSKSTINKKNKTISNIPESKKNSRIVKANSCVKINSLSSEQASKVTLNNHSLPFTKPQLPNRPLPNYSQSSQNHHLIDKPPSFRNSVRNQAKSSIETIPMQEIREESTALHRLREKNEDLTKENTVLRQKCCELQEMGLRDKEKIKNLIIRINQVKQTNTQFSEAKTVHPSTGKLITINAAEFNQNSASQGLLPRHRMQTPYKNLTPAPCESRECQQRKKYLQGELYRERIMRDKLQLEKRDWERNRDELKHQYNELLSEIKEMRDNQY